MQKLTNSSRPRRLGWTGALMALLLAGATPQLTACGGEEESASEERARPARAARSRGASRGGRGGGGPEIEDDGREISLRRLQAVERRDFPATARDPFTPPVLAEDDDQVLVVFQPECNVDNDPLGMTNYRALRLIGLVTGTTVPRAMFIAPGSPQAIILSEGALVGPNCNFRLQEIRDNEVHLLRIAGGEGQQLGAVIALQSAEPEAEVEDVDRQREEAE